MKKKQTKKGFTLIELMLSISFLASIAVMIAVLVSNATSTYRHGATIKSVNLVGSEILEDLRTSINNMHATDIATACEDVYDNAIIRDQCKADDGLSFVSLTQYAPVIIKGERSYVVNEDGTPVYGAFCTGKYTYIWNSGYFFNSEDYQIGSESQTYHPVKVQYKDETPITNFKLLKVLDEKRSVCVDAVKRASQIQSGGSEGYIPMGSVENVPDEFVVNERPVELISGEAGETLALYDLVVTKPAQASTSRVLFYSGFFILGSVSGGVDIGSQGDYCKAYVDRGISDKDYCAVNRFDFAFQTSSM